MRTTVSVRKDHEVMMVDPELFQNGGLWIPAEEQGSDWLIVALHGSNGSCRDFEGLEEVFGIPSLNYLYLNGPISSYSNYRWYSDPSDKQNAYRMLDHVFEITSREGYPLEKTFLIGFSQGAVLTFEFGARYHQAFAGYIALSGRIEDLPGLLSEANPSIIRQGRWLVTHGTRDYNLSVDIIRQQVEQLRQAGFRINYQEYDKVHEFDAKEELPYVREWICQCMP